MKLAEYVKRHKKRTAVLLLMAAVISLLLLKNGTKEAPVTRSKVEKRTIIKYVSASGETAVTAQATSYSQLAANVSKIYFKNGSNVMEGDTIMEYDKFSLKASLDSAWSDYLSAKATLQTSFADYEYAKANVKAKKEIRDNAMEEYMGNKNNTNKEAFKTAEANYQSALADQRELNNKKGFFEKEEQSKYSDFLAASKNYANTTLKAKVSGTLILNNINEGQQVTNGQKLFSIANKDTLSFVSEVDETDIVYLKPGQECVIKLDSYQDEEIKGSISLVEAKTITTDAGSTAVKVELEISKDDMALIEGLNGEAKIKVATKENVLTIPFEYTEEDDKGTFVFVQSGNKTQKKRVKVGFETEDFVEIPEGLSEGEQVIRAENLKEGDKVK
ncbi:MAG: efflux RND transporter periplasmic adaptor subunit [Patescibacteria group bacterium]